MHFGYSNNRAAILSERRTLRSDHQSSASPSFLWLAIRVLEMHCGWGLPTDPMPKRCHQFHWYWCGFDFKKEVHINRRSFAANFFFINSKTNVKTFPPLTHCSPSRLITEFTIFSAKNISQKSREEKVTYNKKVNWIPIY